MDGKPLFQLNRDACAYLHSLGGRVPVMMIDELFEDPPAIRESALRMSYHPPAYPNPGKIAELNASEPSLESFLQTILSMVNGEYLPRIRPISDNGRQITRFARVMADFAITDVHPDELEPVQRAPHVDPVPIFGLVYLNTVDRGGTLFFNRTTAGQGADEPVGYHTETRGEYALAGKIEGQFNRLAVYPGAAADFAPGLLSLISRMSGQASG